MQIRDGLHVFGRSPEGPQRDDLLVSIARLPRSEARAEDASLHRALAADLGLGDFDPLTRDLSDAYAGPRPAPLAAIDTAPWRTVGDAVERIERLALALVAGSHPCDPGWLRTTAVLGWIDCVLRTAIAACGRAEISALLRGLDGRFVKSGPAGAPTRGRPDVLPTGRNFFAVDVRAVPTPSAWRIGRLAAERLVEAYWQEEGEWPRAIALSAWGTANMRTGGDDVAQVLALIGACPVWDPGSGRVTGFTIMPLSELKRPRVDVTLRVSGLFRDAFPVQIDLIDSAMRAIAALDEPDEANPLATNARARAQQLEAQGVPAETARRRATYRVFGAKPGAYGAGLQTLVDEGGWDTRADIADVYLSWSSYAYGGGTEGAAIREDLAERLAGVQLVAQAQDNREHDILDSDDYYQFMGGLAATVETLRGSAPRISHVDTSRPEAPMARPLAQEIARVVRGRAANPKWITGVMRHGYKGAFEIAAAVDYLFGFAASTNAVGDHHFDQLFAAYLEDEQVRCFMADANPAALRETAARFAEAMRRGLWRPRSNRVGDLLRDILGASPLDHRETDA
jgi:cobaltochelatase CobN